MEPKRILIIDNSVIQCKELSRHFCRLGYETVIATTAREGLDFIVRHHPDLIILDLILADFDGLEVCQQIKTNAETQKIPVILFSGRSRIIDILRGFNAGADMYITKGLGYEKLVNYTKAIFAEMDHSSNGVDHQLVMKTNQELLASLSAAFDGLVRPRLEISLGMSGAAAVLEKAAAKLPSGWKVQAMREGTYPCLAVRDTVADFSTFVSEVFRVMEESAESIEVSHLKDAFEQQMVFSE